MINRIIILVILFSTTFLFSCEKEITTTTKKIEKHNNDDNTSKNLITVAEFIKGNFGNSYVLVGGYIVGACSKSILNAVWAPPFKKETSVLIADEKGETNPNKVIAISLKNEEMREKYSPYYNIKNYCKMVWFYGKKQKYLGIVGMSRTIVGYGDID